MALYFDNRPGSVRMDSSCRTLHAHLLRCSQHGRWRHVQSMLSKLKCAVHWPSSRRAYQSLLARPSSWALRHRSLLLGLLVGVGTKRSSRVTVACSRSSSSGTHIAYMRAAFLKSCIAPELAGVCAQERQPLAHGGASVKAAAQGHAKPSCRSDSMHMAMLLNVDASPLSNQALTEEQIRALARKSEQQKSKPCTRVRGNIL
jgi:hypothetical protein